MVVFNLSNHICMLSLEHLQALIDLGHGLHIFSVFLNKDHLLLEVPLAHSFHDLASLAVLLALAG